MIVISEFFTVESQLVTLKNKTIFMLIECMVNFMRIFEKSGPFPPHLSYMKKTSKNVLLVHMMFTFRKFVNVKNIFHTLLSERI
jgi:hypothetical protein